jgi:hypothetical protein
MISGVTGLPPGDRRSLTESTGGLKGARSVAGRPRRPGRRRRGRFRTGLGIGAKGRRAECAISISRLRR